MARAIVRLLAAVLMVGGIAHAAAAVPIGLLTFDALTETGATFNVTNLTGGLFAPDFPILTPLTIDVTDLTAVTRDGATLAIGGSNFQIVDEAGDVNCTAPGDAGSGGCNVAAYEIVSATLRGTVSPVTGIAGLPEGFDSLMSTFSATLGPSCGDTLIAGCDLAIIEATPTTAPTTVPEPPPASLLGAGLAALAAGHALGRKSRRRAAGQRGCRPGARGGPLEPPGTAWGRRDTTAGSTGRL
jgi:hypothetical protein